MERENTQLAHEKQERVRPRSLVALSQQPNHEQNTNALTLTHTRALRYGYYVENFQRKRREDYKKNVNYI